MYVVISLIQEVHKKLFKIFFCICENPRLIRVSGTKNFEDFGGKFSWGKMREGRHSGTFAENQEFSKKSRLGAKMLKT
jgi:hypothetical protein